MEQSHTGVCIGDVLRNVWTQFEIPTEKIPNDTRWSNKHAQIDRVHCAIPRIQLVINDSLQSQRFV